MKRILREPLLHFLLLGAGIFLAFGLMSNRSGNSEPTSIVISQGQIASLAENFARAWQRQPSDEELTGLILDRVREEIYAREAMELGLDRDDTIIRRRLRQKMEFLSEDIIAQVEPTETDLNEYLQSHLDAFRARVEPRVSFEQVYLNPEKHGENLARDASQLLATLNEAGDKADVSALGDSLLLGQQFADLTGSEVAHLLGEKFAAALVELLPGQWQGPIESAYGVHFVRVRQRTEGHVPALAEVRDAVRREWENTRRLEANEEFYQKLRNRYAVVIERPLEAREIVATRVP